MRVRIAAALWLSIAFAANAASPDDLKFCASFTEQFASDVMAVCSKIINTPGEAILARANAHFHRGKGYSRLGQCALALIDYKHAMVLDPSWSEPYVQSAHCDVREKRFADAIAKFEAAVKLDPTHHEALAWLGVAYQKIGKLDLALDRLNKSIRIQNSEISLWVRAVVYEEKRLILEAINDLQALIELPLQTHTVLGRKYVFENTFSGQAMEKRDRLQRELKRQAALAPLQYSTGTGFFVSREGHVLTNAHVVDGCSTAEVLRPGGKPEPAVISARDVTNDLALLSINSRGSTAPHLRTGVRTGEAIAVYGYPHFGMLSSTGNFTIGNVTASSGLNDDSRMLQISAPIQSGNSGGPLVDQSGNVVGVIVSKLNVLSVLKAKGDLPQNVNFAIKASVARSFLEANGVKEATARPSATELPPADLADAVKQFTVLIACQSNTSKAE
jgi:S1-C subfamily serine protease